MGDIPAPGRPEKLAGDVEVVEAFDTNNVGASSNDGVPTGVPQCSRTSTVPLIPWHR